MSEYEKIYDTLCDSLNFFDQYYLYQMQGFWTKCPQKTLQPF